MSNPLQQVIRRVHGKRGHAFAKTGETQEQAGIKVEEFTCACGARKLVRTRSLPTLHGCCPHCGSQSVHLRLYDPNVEDVWVGTDVYGGPDQDPYLVWECKSCGFFSKDDFRGDYTPTEVTTEYLG